MSSSPQTTARTVAVVLAGGTGSRVGLPLPKQLVKIAGKPVIEHTLAVFEDSPDIDDIVVYMHPDYLGEVQAIVSRAGFTKVRGIHAGGGTRSDTTRRAITALTASARPGEDPNVLFHDAVRPLVSRRIICDCVRALSRHRAVDVAIPSADTVITTHTRAEEGEFIASVPQRAALRRGQTPQGFKLSTIRQAYEKAARDPQFEATDDCSVVLRYLPHTPVHVVRGEEHNMKITHPVDIFIAEKLFQLATHRIPGHDGDDACHSRLRDKVVVIFGASYGIGADVAALAEQHGARVFKYSRTTTGTYVENPRDVQAALADAHTSAGRIDYVVNTAGLLRIGKLTGTSPDDIAHATAVNYLAPIHIARAAHPYLRQTRGQLLFYTSSSYTRGRAHYGLYSSAKAATVNLTQSLADEWADDHIRVNCINPERTRTPMRLNAFGDEPEDSLLTSHTVATTSIDALLSSLTGQVIDVRRQDPLHTTHPRTPAPAPAPAPATADSTASLRRAARTDPLPRRKRLARHEATGESAGRGAGVLMFPTPPPDAA
ncbi:SDR family NAD(P)-dependent oxidoreductase [Streptomyces sp. NPDC001262]|uniref:SDR family NAD(P)-dependent oxidoreductase n=1 Tax=Streptomyces sp. NPDC001262 TaxID=3364552 RepID=UPI003681DCAC